MIFARQAPGTQAERDFNIYDIKHISLLHTLVCFINQTL